MSTNENYGNVSINAGRISWLILKYSENHHLMSVQEKIELLDELEKEAGVKARQALLNAVHGFWYCQRMSLDNKKK